MQAPSLPGLPVLWAGYRGPLPTCHGGGYAGVGAQYCSFGSQDLRGAACRGGGGRPSWGGWPSTVVKSVGRQALSLPWPPAPWGRQPGFRGPVRGSRGRSVWAWGPSAGPTAACALVSRRCALWGWLEGVPLGAVFRRCEGRLNSVAPPPPAACPLGNLWGSATHVLWARVCGCGGPARSLWLAPPAR